MFLMINGMRTLASCCGHGKQPPTVVVKEESFDKMKELGYNAKINASGIYVWILKKSLTGEW